MRLYTGVLFALLWGRSLFESEYYDFLTRLGGKVREIHNYEAFEKETRWSRPLIVVTYFSKQQCVQCKQRELVIEEMLDRFYPFVEFHKYDCDQELHATLPADPDRKLTSACHDGKDRLPTVSFRTPQEGVYYPYHVAHFKAPANEVDFSLPDALGETIHKFMPVYALKVNSQKEASYFIESFGHLNKTLYFPAEDELPTYFKGLTAYFKDRLEFAYVSPDAYEVLEFFNVTTRPKWVVVKMGNVVFMDRRTYQGPLSFPDLRNYLSIFASKNATDRKVDTGLGNTRVRDQVLKQGSKLWTKDLNFDDWKGNFLYPEEIVIVHVTDTFAMNYPNLLIFQTFYG